MFLAPLIAVSLLGTGATPPLRMALTPYRQADELLQRYRGFADRIGAATGRGVELTVAPDFGAAAEMVLDGRADLAEVTPYAFVNGMQHGKLQPIAADAMVGRPGTGIIITRGGSGITKLEQLKGKKFGFVDRFSSTGFLGPWANLQSKGLDPAALFTWRFVGSHDAVLKQVFSGELDAGAISRHSLDLWKEEHGDAGVPLTILAETSRMPGDVLCASPKLPPEQVKAMSAMVLGLKWDVPADRKVLEPISRKGFLPVEVKEYGWLLRVAATIKQ